MLISTTHSFNCKLNLDILRSKKFSAKVIKCKKGYCRSLSPKIFFNTTATIINLYNLWFFQPLWTGQNCPFFQRSATKVWPLTLLDLFDTTPQSLSWSNTQILRNFSTCKIAKAFCVRIRIKLMIKLRPASEVLKNWINLRKYQLSFQNIGTPSSRCQ